METQDTGEWFNYKSGCYEVKKVRYTASDPLVIVSSEIIGCMYESKKLCGEFGCKWLLPKGGGVVFSLLYTMHKSKLKTKNEQTSVDRLGDVWTVSKVLETFTCKSGEVGVLDVGF